MPCMHKRDIILMTKGLFPGLKQEYALFFTSLYAGFAITGAHARHKGSTALLPKAEHQEYQNIPWNIIFVQTHRIPPAA